MKSKYMARLMIIGLLIVTGSAHAHSESDTETAPEFVWSFTLEPEGYADAWRIVLTPEIMRRLNRSSADDLMIFDAQNRPVPFARVPTDLLSESVAQRRSLIFQANRVAEDQPDSPELSLEFERNGARLRVNAPESESRTDSTEALRYEALLALARPDEFGNGVRVDREPSNPAVEHARVRIEFQTEQRINMQCWLRNADDNAPATRNANLAIQQQSRPLRYRGEFNVPIGESAWHLACYGSTPSPDDLELIEAEWSRTLQIDHQCYFTLHPAIERVSESPEVLAFELPAPYRAARISLASDRSGVFSRLSVSSRSDAEQSWTRRGEMTLSTLENGNNQPLVFDRQRRLRDRIWKIEAEPPLGHIPAMEFDVSNDTLVFLAQGEPPWQLRVGSWDAVPPQLVRASLNELSQSIGPIWRWPEISVSAPQRIGDDRLLERPKEPIEWSRYLLWLVLVIGSVLVIAMAVRLLRSPPDRR